LISPSIGQKRSPCLCENYDFFIPTLYILILNGLDSMIRATLQALESELGDVRKNNNDGTVRGGNWILRAIPSGAMEGTQASFERLLGTAAPQLR
jgi:hypothetical protein